MRKIPYPLLGALLLALFACAPDLLAQGPSVQTRDVVTGLDTPWEILWGPDDWIWMTERAGRVSRVHPETGELKLVYTVPDVVESGETGLLGMALHPDFGETPQVFLVYTYQQGDNIREKVVRYRYDGTTLTEPFVVIENLMGSVVHVGSRLLITPDRKLLVTTGDALDHPNAQNHLTLNGKILRMNLDGSAPADNPWPSAPSPSNLLWTTGHRNTQGLVLAPNGFLYSTEHGPSIEDEVNIIVDGKNYGWPNIHGFCDTQEEQKHCADSMVAEPIMTWTPTIAPAGIDYYNDSAIPEWRNSLLMVTLKESDLRQLKLNAAGTRITSEAVYFDNQYGRLRDLCISPDGRVFIATSNKDGRAAPGFPKAEDDRIVEIKAKVVLPAIDEVTVVGTSFDPGDPIEIHFTTSGTFNPGNVFTAQISNNAGSFAQPRPLGVVEGTATGSIFGRIPCEIPPAGEYRIRVVGNNPVRAGIDNGVDITIRALRTVDVTALTPATFCEGDSSVLTVAGNYQRYRWSNGDTNQTIVVRTPGSYSVTVFDENECGLVGGPMVVRVFPNPTPAITTPGRYDSLDAGAGYLSYQWYINGQAIPGATSRYHQATMDGIYTVLVLSQDGCEGISSPYALLLESVEWENGDAAGVTVYPHPVRDRLTIELMLEETVTVSAVLTDLRGNDLRAIPEERRSGAYRREMSLEGLPSGTYILRVSFGERRWVKKVVKKI